MNTKRSFFVVALLTLALLLAACGGESEPESVSLTFVASDSFEFTPDSATVATGSQVDVELDNPGALEHSWVLVAGDADPLTATDAEAIGGATTGIVAPGESATLSFTAPAAGDYQFVCTIPGHAAAGMVGTFTVTQ